MRRAAVSIPANIAEGFGRWHSKEFIHFLLVASGSLKELETLFSSESALVFSVHQSLPSPWAWSKKSAACSRPFERD
jgi:four helix bundle protein